MFPPKQLTKANQKDTNNTNSFSASNHSTFDYTTLQIAEIIIPSGGILKGFDKKITVNTINGTNSVSIPLPTFAIELSPSLILIYSPVFVNSAFGMGWFVGILSIKRKIEKELPQYTYNTDSDIFTLSVAEDLVPLLKFNEVNEEWENQIRETITSSNIVLELKDYGQDWSNRKKRKQVYYIL